MSFKRSIWVAILNENTIRPELARVLNYINDQTDYEIYIDFSNEKPISQNRNMIVQRFLASKFDYLLMIDDDVVPPQTILSMADYEKDVVGALYFMYQEQKLMPVAFMRSRYGMYNPLNIKSGDGLTEVDAVGTGCIMLSRKVLKAVKAPFINEYDPDGIRLFGLDIAFCQRAKEKDFKVYVHTDFPCSHWQIMDLKRLYYIETSYSDKINELREKLRNDKVNLQQNKTPSDKSRKRD